MTSLHNHNGAASKVEQQQTFAYPPQHSFPPFYTLQPNLTTRASQLSTWSSLILSFAAHNTIYRLTASSPIFHNASLNRRLAPEDAKVVFEHMVSQGRAEFVSPHQTSPSSSSSNTATSAATSAVEALLGTSSANNSASATGAAGAAATTAAAAGGGGSSSSTANEEVFVFWRTADEWFADVDAWVSETGQRNTVLTVWELAEGDASRGRSWEGMPGEMFRRCLAVGARRGKTVMFGSEEEGLGVKFV